MNDPLENFNIEGKGIDTSFPLMEEKDYEFQISESAIVPNKDQNGFNWRLVLCLTAPATAVDGKPIPANSKLFHQRAIQAKDEAEDKELFKKFLFGDVDAIFGTNETTRPDFNRQTVNDAVGKRVIGSVIIDTYKGNKSNKVNKLKPVPTTA